MNLQEIQQLVGEGKYEFSFHAQQERLVVTYGEIPEQYADDPRGESCLILTFVRDIPVHLVLGWALRKQDNLRILRFITVYTPTQPRWMDPRTRGGRS